MLTLGSGQTRYRRVHSDLTSDELMMMNSMTSQVAPWSKTGGLGDVVGSLPMALSRRGHRVMVISPRCRCLSRTSDTVRLRM